MPIIIPPIIISSSPYLVIPSVSFSQAAHKYKLKVNLEHYSWISNLWLLKKVLL